MVDYDESFLVFSSVVFDADKWTTNQPILSSIYTGRYCLFQNNSLHITHIIKLRDIYRIFVNTAMRLSTTFEAL